MTGDTTPISDEARAAITRWVQRNYVWCAGDEALVQQLANEVAPLLVSPEAERAGRYLIDPAHPEAKCQRCGRPNIVWFVRSRDWNIAVPDRIGILCPVCFVAAFEDATGEAPVWELVKAAEKRTPNAELQAEVEGLRAELAERERQLQAQSGISESLASQLMTRDAELAALRAAGGQEPLVEWQCPSCGATTRARMADAGPQRVTGPKVNPNADKSRATAELLPAAPVGGQAEPSDAQIDALFADSWDADDLAEHERVRAAGGSASDQRRAVYRRRLAAAAVSGEQAQPDGKAQR